MSKYPKFSGNKPHSNPDNNGAGEQKRSISGNVHVSGEVLFEPGPKEELSRKAAADEEKTKYREKKWIERTTLLAVIVYATLTAWQAFTTQQIANLTRDQFTKDRRPYVWIYNVGVDPIEVGKPVVASVVFENVGKSPALHVWDVSFITVGPKAESHMDASFKLFEMGAKLVPIGTASILLPENDPNTRFFSRPSSLETVTPELNDWLTQHDTIMTGGRIFYQDMAGNTYQSDYCIYQTRLNGFKGAAYCKEHNDIK